MTPLQRRASPHFFRLLNATIAMYLIIAAMCPPVSAQDNTPKAEAQAKREQMLLQPEVKAALDQVEADYLTNSFIPAKTRDELSSQEADKLKKLLEDRLNELLKKKGKVGDTITNSIGMKLRYIAAGEFLMGRPDAEKGEDDELPQHHVRITKPFLMGVTAVTRGQFAAFVNDSGFKTEAERNGKGGKGFIKGTWQQSPEFTWRNTGFDQKDDHPVVNVCWNDAKAFCQWLGKKEGKKYRLPTEAEREYACRAGTNTPFHFGNTISPDQANYDGRQFNGVEGVYRGKTTAVGSFPANAWGLFDMHGNVWEWCEDRYGPYPNREAVDPTGPDNGESRVARGGSWATSPYYCRAVVRDSGPPGVSSGRGGFRVMYVDDQASGEVEKQAKQAVATATAPDSIPNSLRGEKPEGVQSEFIDLVKQLSLLRVREVGMLFRLIRASSSAGRTTVDKELKDLQSKINDVVSTIIKQGLSPDDIQAAGFREDASDGFRVGTFCFFDREMIIENVPSNNSRQPEKNIYNYYDAVIVMNPLNDSIFNACIIKSTIAIDILRESDLKNMLITPVGDIDASHGLIREFKDRESEQKIGRWYLFYKDRLEKYYWLPIRQVVAGKIPTYDSRNVLAVDDRVGKEVVDIARAITTRKKSAEVSSGGSGRQPGDRAAVCPNCHGMGTIGSNASGSISRGVIGDSGPIRSCPVCGGSGRVSQ